LKTIHLISHAHIDPVWLWPWQAGIDESINTCYSMCNLLDRHPDVIFTQGDAWVYEQVERLNPELFSRIKALTAKGRWEVIGGWYIQPDCNLPSAWGLQKQIELGRSYFERALGVFPTIAYNIDSFGHAAYVPELISRAGQTHYIMMRPKANERELPARLFRWRGYEDGPEIVTFRIPVSYLTPNGMNIEHVAGSLTELPPGLDHTMCFYGCSDHGGGPTEEMVAWVRDHVDAIPGARIEFSSPSRFFKAARLQNIELPLVVGELQMHAVGCYSVHREVKRQVRKAEHLLDSAEHALKANPALAPDQAPLLTEAWRKVCFNHFHDTLCGSSIASAYDPASDQLGFAKSVADDILQYALRFEMQHLPPDPRQRIVLRNFGATDFDDWIEHEPWVEMVPWQPGWGLIDEDSRQVPLQVLLHEAFTSEMTRLMFRLQIPAGGVRVLRIAKRDDAARPCSEPAHVDWERPRVQLVEDLSDTWSHDVSSYNGPVVADAVWDKRRDVDCGPLMWSQIVDGKIGSSPITAEWRRYAGASFHELRLRIMWQESFRILRLTWELGEKIVQRSDGIPGGALVRASDGAERPVRDLSLLELASGRRMGVVMPDSYSLSATDTQLRLTLLRSSLMAQGGSIDMKRERKIFSDQGPRNFIFRFYPRGDVSLEQLESDAYALQRRPVIADDTRGMPWRPLAHQIERPL